MPRAASARRGERSRRTAAPASAIKTAKSVKATAIYARLHLDPVRAALETTSSMVTIPDMIQSATVEDPIDA